MVRVVTNVKVFYDDEVKRNLNENQSSEPKDTLATNNLERMNVVLGDEFLLPDKLASSHKLQ